MKKETKDAEEEKEEKNGKKTNKKTEAADDKGKETQRNKDKKPLDTFIPRAIKAAPGACEQESKEPECSFLKAMDRSEMDVNQQKSKEQDSRELGCSSSKAMDG